MISNTTPVRGHPASLAILGVIVGLIGATALVPRWHPWLIEHFADSWDRLRVGEIWRVFTSAFVQSKHGFVLGIMLLMWLLPLAESRLGSRTAATAFFAGDWISSLAVMIAMRLTAAVGIAASAHALGRLDSGASAGFYACGGAFLVSLTRGRMRTVLALVLVGDLIIEGVRTHMLAEIQHPVAVLVGAAVASAGLRRA
jgi:hypothetical protein